MKCGGSKPTTYLSIIKLKRMKLIKLTSSVDGKPVFINVECIGHFYQVKEKVEYGRVVKEAYTKVGVTTHNNGGFEVAEDVKQIMARISKVYEEGNKPSLT